MKTKILLLLLGSMHLLMAQPNVKLSPLATGFTAITDISHAGDQRIFIAEKSGFIKIVDKSGLVNPVPYLDISTKVLNQGEGGLLGLAFHPNYATNGYFYVNTINKSGNTELTRYQVAALNPDKADTNSRTVLLTFTQPFSNHNGGDLNFGPDGYLYISSGDGGSGGDPFNYAQNLSSYLGKILRIDVNTTTPGYAYGIPASNPFVDGEGGYIDEIWSYGLRNPWRFSFDRLTGDMWIADVGQSQIEEINRELSASAGGLNYGWKCYEGNQVYDFGNCNAATSFTFPVYAYNHSLGCSITGAFVYRGTRYPALYGRYIYTDFCQSNIWSLRQIGGVWTSEKLLNFSAGNINTFGEDNNGELYAGTNGGVLYRLCDGNSVAASNNLQIDSNPIPSNQYQAGNFLNSSGKVVNNSAVSFYALRAIELQQGFEANAGAVFSAKIEGCSN